MSLVGQILHTGIKLSPKKPLLQLSPKQQQIKVLHRLLRTAQNTDFGKRYDFEDLTRIKDPRAEFRQWIPIYSYDKMYSKWWHRSLQDEPNVTWPGIIPYYGVSSGSTQAASKYIPVTHESLHCWNKSAQRLFSSLSQYPEITPQQLGRQSLMVGGTSKLTREGQHLYGDNSGIMALNRPYWLKSFYKPDADILEIPDWNHRVNAIVAKASSWNIAFLVGNVAWVQLILERIIEYHGIKHIHKLWPNLTMLMHSGIFLEPYRESFENTLGKPISYIDTYAATEAFIGYQDQPNDRSMKLVLDQGVYYEFVPFDQKHFDETGNLISSFVETIPIEYVEENKPYAILISTTSGAWHYLLGDVIVFTDKQNCRIKITGRTKLQLNLTGEHLTGELITGAIQHLNQLFHLDLVEYTVSGEKHESHFAHKWYLATNKPVDKKKICTAIDEYLKTNNDDYSVQRTALLNNISVELVQKGSFYGWLHSRGKMNGQAKIPCVLSEDLKHSWLEYLHKNLIN